MIYAVKPSKPIHCPNGDAFLFTGDLSVPKNITRPKDHHDQNRISENFRKGHHTIGKVAANLSLDSFIADCRRLESR